MDILQQAPGASLIILALIDATSIGTLVIPVWLLLRGDYRRVLPRVVAYLAMIALFYWAIGVAITAGFSVGSMLIPEGFFEHRLVRLLLLVAGAGMLLWALSAESPAKKRAKIGTAQSESTRAPQTQVLLPQRIRSRLSRALETPWGVVSLALVAAVLELPTMLPYLGALSVLQHSQWPPGLQLLALLGYCLVMIAPALVLVLVRRVAGARLDHWLQKIGAKLSRYAQETLGWIVGIAGFLIVRTALNGVQLGELLNFSSTG